MADTADNVSSDGAGVGGVGWGVGWGCGWGVGGGVIVKGGVVYIEAVAPGVGGLEAWFADVDWHYGIVWCFGFGFGGVSNFSYCVGVGVGAVFTPYYARTRAFTMVIAGNEVDC